MIPLADRVTLVIPSYDFFNLPKLESNSRNEEPNGQMIEIKSKSKFSSHSATIPTTPFGMRPDGIHLRLWKKQDR
jgi:hypothetical protein